ncbi:LPXTG cell wall anchor domain-containing protein [Staphylococcus gallinarum]|uniref:LPXTG cell wall anchor domain-containing protein n=1 Tax=Staphylococcus TaxID=1279 RepID=UPI000D1EBA6D|nr:LPXTG cell wall anchor domain-containing protein [Staphylococcus gallinarum]MCD8820620.1 LPXTG cell wall anchor domain-containing protein [Staphylococcus gallinarum]PTK89607.1 cell wall protein [Staphylococcus gallinarum]PTL08508.1 cell wall protein [Staphylococcus gallinarum]PTL09788.1 cell wall protein [Staphylococcus gallinarum]RIL33387.1 LPXTG cell wall anchor domain-containing protein [Staphylococcus gallinarum]
MKKALVAATIASSILGSGIYTSQAHADEEKRQINVFTEKEFNEHRTGATEGFGGGPGSDVRIVDGNETYQEYLNRVKKGQALSESAAPIEYIYPEEAQNILQGNATNNAVNQNSENANNAAQANNTVTKQNSTSVNNASANTTNEESKVQSLPETGEQHSNTTLGTWFAFAMLTVGSILTFKRFLKNHK